MTPNTPLTLDLHVNSVPAKEAFVALRALNNALELTVPAWAETEAAQDVRRILAEYEPIIDSFRCPSCGWDSVGDRAAKAGGA